MSYLLDTGILLRLVDKSDQRHGAVSAALSAMGNRGDELLIATQNVAEFCNVVTRPILNNGLALLPAKALELLELEVEPICTVLQEPSAVYDELKRLIDKYSVVGKQVHDARLVAMMLVWQIDSILTLNDRDFRRYEPEGIAVATPESN